MPVSELTDLLWGYTCVAGYFIAAPLFVLLLYLWFFPPEILNRVLRPSFFIVLLAAFFTAVLVLPCHVDLSFQPSPARW